MFTDYAARRFVIGVLLAFLPAAVIGAAAHGFIKNVLFNPWIVCFTLIAGGAVLLLVDRLELKPRYHDSTKFTLPMYFIIGFFQCLAMIPGVSRSGATIVGADRREDFPRLRLGSRFRVICLVARHCWTVGPSRSRVGPVTRFRLPM